MKVVVVGLGLSLVIGVTSTVAAETTEEALKAFGLLGTWSTDCADSTKTRVTFEKDKMVGRQPGSPGESVPYQAERVTEDKLRVTIFENGRAPDTRVVEKVGQKFKIQGMPAEMLWERCPN